MALKFNTFRSERYLRSRFIEGRYFLASEATDLELEMLDASRQMIRTTLGNVAVDDAWKVEKYEIETTVTNVAGTTLTLDTTLIDLILLGDEVYKNGTRIDTISSIDTGANTITLPSIGSIVLNDTITIKVRNTLLVRSGEAWFDGIPFVMDSGEDNLVSGSNLAMGVTLPIGGGSANVSAQDEPNGAGKLVTFNDGGTTPAGEYRIVITAREEVITDIEDPFLKNANIPESTGQKMRLTYRINVVPEASIDSSPVPYTDSVSDGNLVNEISVTPTLGGEGAETSRVTITGSEQIDGRNLEVNFKNTVGVNKLPLGTTQQSEYSNGKLVDSLGNTYHINLITNATVSNEVTVRLDKAYEQPDPTFIAGKPYKLIKRDVFVTDDVNGNPQGQLYYPLATVNLVSGSGFAHTSNVTDLREKIISKVDFEEITNTKFGLKLTGGGSITWEVVDTDILEWAEAYTIINPHAPSQTIAANQVALIDGASVAYFMDLENGGAIQKGNLAITVSGGTTTLTLSGNPDLTNVSIGNMVKVGTDTRYITDIDNVLKTITVNTAIGTSGAGTIYLDTFAQGLAPITEELFVLAVRDGTKVYFSNLELSSGETSTIGSAIPQAFLDYVGTPSENDSTPDYTSPQVYTITNIPPASIDDSDHFTIHAANDSNQYYVWFDKSGSAVDPAPPYALTGVEVDISSAVTDDDVAEAVRAALDALGDFSATRVDEVVTVTNAADGTATVGANATMAFPFSIETTPGSPAVVTDGTSLTQGIIDLDKGHSDINNVLEQPIYDESIYYPTGLPALTTINLPLNTRFFNRPQQIVTESGALEVKVNSRETMQDVDWVVISENGGPEQQAQIRFNYALPNDTTVVFRLDSLGGSTSQVISVSGGDNWSDPVDSNIIPDTDNAYDLGAPTFKFKDGYFAGKLTVDGVIDPTGLELTPQASDPLAAGQAGIYIDSASDDLIVRRTNDTTTNITVRLDDLEAGTSIPITGGAGLTKTGNDLSVNVDDSTIEINADTLRIKAAGVTESHLNASVAGDGLSGGAGTPLAVNVDGITIQITTDTLELVPNSINSTYIAPATITPSELNTSVAGLGLSGGNGSNLEVNVDGTTIEIVTDTLQIVGGGVNTTQLADSAVTVDKLNVGVAGNGLSGGGGSALDVQVDGTTITINGSNQLSVLGADVLEINGVAGESFAANTTFLVRWAVDGETAGRLYKADSSDAIANPKYLVIGTLLSSTAVIAGDPVTILIKGSHTLGSSDTNFNAADIGLPVYLTTTGAFSLTPPITVNSAQYRVGEVEDVDKIFIDAKQLNAIVPTPIYDERTLYPSGLAATTTVTIPTNSRSGLQETYSTTAGDLKIFVNQKLTFQGIEWSAVNSTDIQWNIELPSDTEVHYRKEQQGSGVLTSGAGGGGSGTLQDAYDNGRIINVTSGNPVTINGPASEKLLVINGDIDVTGVIDPTAIVLTPQATSPLTAGQVGIFVDSNTNNLCFEDGVGGQTDLTASTVLTTRKYTNNTGAQIDAYTVVYSPVAGEIAKADGTDANKFRVIGITTESIADGAEGNVAINGTVSGITGLTHNKYVYLGTIAGSINSEETIFPSGFHLVKLGVMEGTNLILQPQYMGTQA